MHFTIVGEISHIEAIAKGRGIRCYSDCARSFGGSNWRKMKGVALVELQNGHQRQSGDSIGMKRTGSAASGSKSNGSSTKRTSVKRPLVAAVVCLKNGGCGDLELRKLYRLLPDKKASAEGYLRVVDESGEDYLYPAKYFAVVHVPASAAKVLIS